MVRIGITLGSTRPNRNGEQVANWVYDNAVRRGDADYEARAALDTMPDQVVAWSTALAPLRAEARAA
jgi:hypothetical protein